MIQLQCFSFWKHFKMLIQLVWVTQKKTRISINQCGYLLKITNDLQMLFIRYNFSSIITNRDRLIVSEREGENFSKVGRFTCRNFSTWKMIKFQKNEGERVIQQNYHNLLSAFYLWVNLWIWLFIWITPNRRVLC